MRKSFDAVHENPLWYNWGPRVAATYDLSRQRQDRRQGVAGASISIRSTPARRPTRTPTSTRRTSGTTLNGDLIFQPGNATWNGSAVRRRRVRRAQTAPTTSRSPCSTRACGAPYRNEFTVGVDHELFPNILLEPDLPAHARARHHRARSTTNIDLWDQLFTPVTLTEPGRDGIAGTGDDQPITVYNQNSAAPSRRRATSTTIASRRATTAWTSSSRKRYSTGWTLLAGYTYSRTRVDLTSLANPEQRVRERRGRERRPAAQLQGERLVRSALPDPVRRQLPPAVGPADHADVGRSAGGDDCVQGAVTVNAEPRGSVELDWLPTLDLRAGRFFNFRADRLELSVDFYNATNANTVFGVRTSTGIATDPRRRRSEQSADADHRVPVADAAARAAGDPVQCVV